MNFRSLILDPIATRFGYAAKLDFAAGGLADPHRYDTSHERNKRGTNKGSGMASFASLRAFADDCEMIRLAIQKRKGQLLSMDWDIVAREGVDDGIAEPEIKIAKDFFGTQGGLGGPGRRYRNVVNAIVEDLMVIGCFGTYRRPTRGGQTFSVEPIDAGTIKPLLTDEGWVPTPPDNAYEQWIKGKCVNSFTSDQLWYETWDLRTYSRWTRSPVEYILGSAIQFLAIETWNLSWFRNGDSEFTYWQTPEDWTVQQVKDFNAFVKEVNEDLKKRQQGVGGLGIPGGPKRINGRPRKEAEYEKTGINLARRIATAFDLNLTVLGFEGETYKVSQEGQANAAEQWGNKPMCLLLNDFFTDVIQHDLGLANCEFRYDLSEANEEKAARTAQAAGPRNLAPNDAREMMGLEPAEGPYVDCLYEIGQSGQPVIIGWRKGAKIDAKLLANEAGAEPTDDTEDDGGATSVADDGSNSGSGGGDTVEGGAALADAARAVAGKLVTDAARQVGQLSPEALKDVSRWRRKSRSRALDGRSPAVSFESDLIPEPLAKAIAEELEEATTADEVRKVFSPVLKDDHIDASAVATDVRRLLEQVEEERGRRSSFTKTKEE